MIISDDLLAAANNNIPDLNGFNANNNHNSFINNFIDFKEFLPLNLKKEENYLSSGHVIKIDCNLEDNSVDMKDFY